MRMLLLVPLPAVVVLMLVLLAMLPWGGPAWLEMALALTALGAIYFWSVRRPRLLPAPVVFVSGLLLDVMTQGPLGVWAAAALIVALAARLERQSRVHLGMLRRVASIAAALALSVCVVAVVTSLHQWQLVALRPVGEALIVAVLAYPFLAGMLSLLDGLWPVVDGRSLFLRGD